MRVMRRHPGVRHVAEHPVVIAKLEFLRIEVEAELGGLGANPFVPLDEIVDRPGGEAWRLASSCRRAHFFNLASCCLRAHDSFTRTHYDSLTRSLARNALNDGQMSSLRSISTVWKLGAWIRRNTLSIEDS